VLGAVHLARLLGITWNAADRLAKSPAGILGFTLAEAHRTIANGLARGRRNPRFTSSHEHR
jgi:hypothetical protein